MHHFDLEAVSAELPAAALIGILLDSKPEPFPRLVVEAPPGTGKTTVVPPLLAEHLAAHERTTGRIVVCQPRRMAARAAARRLAHLSGTRLGEEVGYTVRGDRVVSARTRVEFVTTGVLVRRLLADPELAGTSAVILDEVHERHLDSDLAFAMCRELADLREDLSFVVMSATLDAAGWARRLGTPEEPAPVLSVQAEIHPLEIVWTPAKQRPLDARGVTWAFLDHMAETTAEALHGSDGDVLVFAPGAREVDEVAARIARRLGPVSRATVHALTGRTPAKEQDAILKPHADGPRRIIVATSVAESALTIPGVRTVVDSGLARGPRLDTRRAMSGLVTVRESKAAGTQRAGRAARLGPGTVHRLMSQADWAALPEHTPPEIATSDLTSAVLDLAVWGGDVSLLPDPMPAAPMRLAVENLRALGALTRAEDGDAGWGTITELGRAMARIPASPWAARGLLDGAELLGPRAAAEAVAVIEHDARAPGSDLAALLRNLRRSGDRTFRQETNRLTRMARDAVDGTKLEADDPSATGSLQTADLGLVVALSFPRQIARLRPGSADEYLLASGTAATLPRDSSLLGSPWLAVAEVALNGDRALVRAAAMIDEDVVELAGAGLLTTEETAVFTGGKVKAVRRSSLGAIELSSTPITATRELARRAVAEAVSREGARSVLAPTESFEALRTRIGLVRATFGDPWPDVRWPSLGRSLENWAPDALDRIAVGRKPASVDLVSSLRGLLPWPEAARLDALVPESLEVPSGSRIRVRYPDPDLLDGEDSEVHPVLAVKLQECFGWTEAPRICDGRVPVLLHLLSPAGRPLAVTSDLASFWANAYAHVRAENRGRYPKHPWPEDPLTAPAQRGVKNPRRR